jgi:hypothetical protein
VRLSFAAIALALLGPGLAGAHVELISHETRHGHDGIKFGPCGLPDSERGSNVYRYEPGETITLVWDEYIYHPGYFRISFDEQGDDDFVDPRAYFDFYTNDTVLLDDVYRHDQRGDNIFSIDLTLPYVECDECTLQLAQIMTDKPPYVPGTNDLYYNCVDLVLPEPAPGASAAAALLALAALSRTARRRPGAGR